MSSSSNGGSNPSKRQRTDGNNNYNNNNDITNLEYLPGFGNTFKSEALRGALPKGQHNPQRPPYGLYAEQLSGTAFTRPRGLNFRSWLYRIRPSVQHVPFIKIEAPNLISDFEKNGKLDPNQMRWFPPEIPSSQESKTDFVEGLTTVGGAGSPSSKNGFATHMYVANASMDNKCFCNADGDFLIVPQTGALTIRTEFGVLYVEPKEICVVQRGMRFSIDVQGPSRGYILELFSKHFSLPDLGPIGANGLANVEDFLHPVAAYEDKENIEYTIVEKFGGELFKAVQSFSPFNVVAYMGNYVPYKYDLQKFNCMNSVTYDHPDPSIYTVLTCPSEEQGIAVADFVIFPPRWMVMEHTFRPPYYHRNCMCEFMGMIYGVYDAKGGSTGKDGKPKGFVPGGSSLHSPMSAHGPDANTHTKASAAPSKPHFFDGGLAFMFETSHMMKLTDWALNGKHRDVDYYKCWANLPRNFNPNNKGDDDGETLSEWRNKA